MTERRASTTPVDFDDRPWTKDDRLAMTFASAYLNMPRTWPIDDVRLEDGEWRIVTHTAGGHEISFKASLMRHVPDETADVSQPSSWKPMGTALQAT